jgi:hypothetical protein
MGRLPRLHLALQAWRIASRGGGLHVAAGAWPPAARPAPQVLVEQGRGALALTLRTGPVRWPAVIMCRRMGDSATPDAPGPRIAVTVGAVRTRKPQGERAAKHPARELTQSIRCCRTVGMLCGLVDGRISAFDYIHVATAFHRLATLIKGLDHKTGGQGHQRRQGRAAGLDHTTTRGYGAGNGPGSGHGLGSGPARPVQLSQTVELLENRAVLLMPEFQARAVSNVWWACATMREPPSPRLVRALLQRSLLTIDDFVPQTIANTLWSLATLRIKAQILKRLALYSFYTRLLTFERLCQAHPGAARRAGSTLAGHGRRLPAAGEPPTPLQGGDPL